MTFFRRRKTATQKIDQVNAPSTPATPGERLDDTLSQGTRAVRTVATLLLIQVALTVATFLVVVLR